jgi:hypothetical protein
MSITYPLISGNWSIDNGVVDTITTPKTISIPDFDWTHDFGKAIRPLKSKDAGITVANTTGASLQPNERVRFERRSIANVYTDTLVPLVQQLDVKQGLTAYCEVEHTYPATNSVNGDVVYLPIKGTFSLRVPADGMVTEDFVEGAFLRVLGALFDTGDSGADRIIEVLRGQLAPNCCLSDSAENE